MRMRNVLALLLIGFLFIGCGKTHENEVGTIVEESESVILSKQAKKLDRQIEHERMLLATIIISNSCDDEAFQLFSNATIKSVEINVKHNPLKEGDIKKSNEEKATLIDYIKGLQRKAEKL